MQIIHTKLKKNLGILCALGLIFSIACTKSTSKLPINPNRPTPPIVEPITTHIIAGLGTFTVTNSGFSEVVAAESVTLHPTTNEILVRFLLNYEEDLDLTKVAIKIELEDANKEYSPKDPIMDFSNPVTYTITDKTTEEDEEQYIIKVEIQLVDIDQLNNDCKVANAEELKKLRRVKSGQNCIITNNISIKEPFKPIFGFVGNLDGQNKTISIDQFVELKVDEEDTEEIHRGIGFFRDLKRATVTNLTLKFPETQYIEVDSKNKQASFGLFAAFVENSQINHITLEAKAIQLTTSTDDTFLHLSTFIGYAIHTELNHINLMIGQNAEIDDFRISIGGFSGLIAEAQDTKINDANVKIKNLNLSNHQDHFQLAGLVGIGKEKVHIQKAIVDLEAEITSENIVFGGLMADVVGLDHEIAHSKVKLALDLKTEAQVYGGLVGHLFTNLANPNTGLKINKSFSEGEIKLSNMQRIDQAGGLIAAITGTLNPIQAALINTYSTLSFDADCENVGGLIGFMQNSEVNITNSYAVGFNPNTDTNGALLGNMNATTIDLDNVYVEEGAQPLGFTDVVLSEQIGQLEKGENPLGNAFEAVINGYPILTGITKK